MAKENDKNEENKTLKRVTVVKREERIIADQLGVYKAVRVRGEEKDERERDSGREKGERERLEEARKCSIQIGKGRRTMDDCKREGRAVENVWHRKKHSTRLEMERKK